MPDPQRQKRMGQIALVGLLILAAIVAIPKFFPQLGLPDVSPRQPDAVYEDRLRNMPYALGFAIIVWGLFKIFGPRS